MKGDFTRITYNDQKHYSLLLMQQGRVQLDADWNEQAIIQWLNLQKLVEDLIGEHGGPNDGFKIEPRIEGDSEVTSDFMIKKGRYYVEGVMCENDDLCPFTKQDDYPVPEGEGIQSQGIYLVYLHVWWRHITTVEDDYIREVALKGPDTATRVKTVWQVKAKALEQGTSPSPQDIKENYEVFKELLEDETKRSTGMLKARAKAKTPVSFRRRTVIAVPRTSSIGWKSIAVVGLTIQMIISLKRIVQHLNGHEKTALLYSR